jgi:hypothetical protein
LADWGSSTLKNSHGIWGSDGHGSSCGIPRSFRWVRVTLVMKWRWSCLRYYQNH